MLRLNKGNIYVSYLEVKTNTVMHWVGQTFRLFCNTQMNFLDNSIDYGRKR